MWERKQVEGESKRETEETVEKYNGGRIPFNASVLAPWNTVVGQGCTPSLKWMSGDMEAWEIIENTIKTIKKKKKPQEKQLEILKWLLPFDPA